MTKRIAILTVLVVLTGGAALIATTPPASADTGSVRTERGEVPARIDITRLRVVNAVTRFTMQATVRDLGQRGVFEFSYWRGLRREPPGRSLIIEVRRVGGETRARFFGCGREDCLPEPCRGLRARWRAGDDVVEVSAPQRCYPRGNPDGELPKQGRFFVSSRASGKHDLGPSALAVARG